MITCVPLSITSLSVHQSTLAQGPRPTVTTNDAALTSLLDEIWDYEISVSPLLATNIGDPRNQDRFADQSIAAIETRSKKRKDFLERLLQCDSSKLSDLALVDRELAKQRLESQLSDFRFRLHQMPLSNRGGFHIEFPELANVMNPTTVEEFEDYIARLKDFPRVVNEHIELMRLGLDSGLTQPAIIMRESESQASAHIVDKAEQSRLWANIPQASIDAVGPEAWKELTPRIKKAIRDEVIPGYRKFAEFLREEYLPGCRGTVGASALEQGRELYVDRVRRFTTLDISPEALHETGIKENDRIRKRMIAIKEELKFDGDLNAFVEYLRTDPKFYAKSGEELLQKTAYVLKLADGGLPNLFGKLPRIPYGIREIPDYVAPQTTSAYYWPPATDGSRGGFYYVNTYNLSSRPLYQVESLSLHEAVPGHHLQLALQAEITNLHPMSRESNVTAFIEGWALYSERLGYELGFYTDPYQEFGRLSMEAWRASRLVVDTGIHWLGWSRKQAIEYLKDHTALSEHNVVAEVDRYIGWPGQALAYKTGELEIVRLREEAEQALGERFDRRDFHDKVLEVGAIPLPLLRSRVADWIQSQ
ncbi:MAG: DUF885 domain-containing protein [Planctomycetota bacterium]